MSVDFGTTFNVDELPVNNFSTIPPGKYVGMLTNSEIKENEYGKTYNITVTIQDGEYKNRKIFQNLNIFEKPNMSENDTKKYKSALALLGTLCNALGVKITSNDHALRNKRFMMTLIVLQPKDDGGTARNYIKAFHPYITEVAATGTDTPW